MSYSQWRVNTHLCRLMSEINVKTVIKPSLLKNGTITSNISSRLSLASRDELLGKLRRIFTLTLVDTPSGFCVCLQMWMWAQAEGLEKRYGNRG